MPAIAQRPQSAYGPPRSSVESDSGSEQFTSALERRASYQPQSSLKPPSQTRQPSWEKMPKVGTVQRAAGEVTGLKDYVRQNLPRLKHSAWPSS
ncbi:hypothetical protein KCV01_g26826, partial [Aureobasidium melanogenum]